MNASAATGKPGTWSGRMKSHILRQEWLGRWLGWYGLYQFANHKETHFRNLYLMFFMAYRNRHFRKWLLLELMSQPDCRRTIESRQRITITMAGLASCAEGTLGRALHDYMVDNGLEFVAPFDAPAHSDAHYAIHRILVTHDVYHAVLGAGTSEYGEALVAAFTNAQITCYAPSIIYSAAGALRCATSGLHLIESGLPGTVIGYLLGRSSVQLFSVDWDRQWSRPLAEIRREWGIDPAGVKAMVDRARRTRPETSNPGRPRTLKELLNDDSCRQDRFEQPGGNPAAPGMTVIRSYRPASEPIATVILGPAPSAGRDDFAGTDEPTLAACLVHHGLRVLAPRFPGAGPVPFTRTLETAGSFIELARRAEPGRPVFLLGHGTAGLAFLAAPARDCDGVITLGTGAWHPELRDLPGMPPRAVLSVASEADRVATPDQVRALHARLGVAPRYLIVQGLGHRDLAASDQAWDLWEQIAAWIRTTAARGACAAEPFSRGIG